MLVGRDHSPVEARRVPVVSYAILALEPSRRFVVRDAEGGMVGACAGRCTLALAPGEYDLAPLDEDGIEDTSTEFEVVESGRMEFEDPNRTAATAGLLMGLGGPALMLLGGALFVSQVCVDTCQEDDSDPLLGYAALGSMLTGLVATPIGWVIYASNQSPVILDASAARLSKSVGMGRSRMTLGIRGAF